MEEEYTAVTPRPDLQVPDDPPVMPPENEESDFLPPLPENPMQQMEEMLPTMSPSNEEAPAPESSSMLSNIGMMVAGIFIAVLVIKFGIQAMIAAMNPTKISLISGMINGTETIIIYQDPSVSNAIQIPRSNNTADGIEFTYSVWLYLLNPSSNPQPLNHIFNKGNGTLLPTPMSSADGSFNYVINGPGVYVTNINELIIIMNTYNSIDENIRISNLPINKWFSLIIRCNSQTLDVFINGNITQSLELLSIPKQNYGNLNIALNNGFQGYLSDLIYYSYILGTKEISSIVQKGPTTTQSSMSSVTSTSSNSNYGYLSTRWYFGGIGDMYNPKQM